MTRTLLFFALTAGGLVAQTAITAQAKAKALAKVHEYIKDHLKAPATAVFTKETFCTTPDECKPGYLVYRSSVDAQNSYGALIRTKYKLEVVNDKSGKMVVMDLDTQMKEACEHHNTFLKTVSLTDLKAMLTNDKRPLTPEQRASTQEAIDEREQLHGRLEDCNAKYPEANR